MAVWLLVTRAWVARPFARPCRRKDASLSDDLQIFGRLTAALLATCLVSACNQRPTEVYEIPYGYRGWVEILQSRSQCPPLPVRSGKVIFAIHGDGTLCTSSPVAFGVPHDEFYYVKGNERIPLDDSPLHSGCLIWQVEYFRHDDGREPRRRRDEGMRFFVGTGSEYRGAGVAK